MKIKNIDGLTAQELQEAVTHGGRFVHYPYTLSLIIVTFKRTSGVYLVREHENAAAKGFIFTLLSALFGWWGIPYGPKYTFESIKTNFKGGKDVTDEVMSVVAGYVQFEEAKKRK